MGRRAFVGLLVAGLLMQAALAKASYNDQNDNQNSQKMRPQPFQQGYEYVFQYDAQLATGLVSPSSDFLNDEASYNSVDLNGRKSVSRLQAKVTINFITENRATLQLSQLRIGRLNNEMSADPKRIQPMRIFELTEEVAERLDKYELPIDFVYVDGVVERINFHPEDSVWSKNIKRAVLNQIQVNLKRKIKWSSKQQQQKQESSQQSQEELSSFSVGQIQSESFVVPETSVEGICQTIYTINDNTNSRYQNEKSSETQQQQDDDDELMDGQFNVTKSINFKNCRKIADISFGYQPQESAKAAKCARATQNANANGRFAPIDDESCDPKELDNTKLDRSTVQRIELVGNVKRFGIKRSETLSQYVLKNFNAQTADETAPSAMHTFSVVQLVLRGVKSSQNPSKTSHFQLRDLEPKNGNGELTADSLLYDNEWERTVKEFYMLGDEQFNAQNSPFKHVQKKAEQAQHIVRRLMQAWNDKQNVMEGETVAQLHRLVHILRISTVEELKEIESAVKSVQQVTGQNSRADAQKIEQLFADSLAIAGTRNTVYLLVQKIHNGELDPEQAAQSLKKLHNVPAPSDAITTMVGQLAKNELAHRSPALQQKVWLTFGAMVNRLFRQKISTKVQQKEQQPERPWSQQQQLRGLDDEKTNGGQQEMLFGTQNGFPNKESAGSWMKKKFYKQMLIKNYEQAQSTYEKVLALKAIGNAGLDNTVNEIEKIANGKTNESPMIRAVAIDALRRLRTRMPRKIQRIMLPIFQNTYESPDVRMTAFAALMNSQPEAPILDQVLYTLSKERSRQVQSYAYSTAKALSDSKVQESQNIAKHLKSALQLTGVSEEEMSRDSLKVELPFLWSESGVILKLITMYNEKQSLPAQLAFGLDSIFKGQKNIDSDRISLAQQGTQGWLENAVEALLNGSNNEDYNDKTTRDRRQQATNLRLVDEEMRSLIPGLQIKKRQQSQQLQKSKYAPFAMISLRFGDVDQAIFALDHHSLPQPLRQLLEDGQSAPIAAIIRQLVGQLENQHIRWISAVQLNEKVAHVPTSIGIPLKISQSAPLLVSVDANAKVHTSGQALDSSSAKASVNAHIAVTGVHLQKMEAWTPVQSWGVMSKRAIELQMPIQAEIYNAESSEENNEKSLSGLKIALKVPQTPKMCVFGVHSFAATYIIDQINMHRHIDAHTNNAIKMRAIRNPALQQTLSEPIEMNEQCYGENVIGIPICFSGIYSLPSQPTNLAQWLQVVMATENDIHVSLQPKGNGPRAVIINASGELFNRAAVGQVKEGLSQLEKFYENAEDNFHPAYPEEYRDMNMNTYEERRYKLEQILKKLTKGNLLFYKHSLKLSVRTEGGDKKNVNAQLKIQAIADSRLKAVYVIADAQRSPLFAQENQPWTLKAKANFLTPETVSSPAELERLQSGKQQTFLGKVDAEWGTDRKEYINIRIQGNNLQRKNANNGEEKQLEQRELSNQWSSDEIQQQQHKKQRAVSFINHFEVAVVYKLSPQSQSIAKQFFDNSYNVNINRLRYSDSQPNRNGRDGQIYASLMIDPQTAKQANVQLRTSSQIIKVNGLELPTTVRLMPLIKHGEKSAHSVAQFLSRVTRDATRDECKVDGRRVMSFDGPVFKGPITTKCYQVLALDCVNPQQPKFAVLMRSLDASGQQKKIKVMMPEQVVECQAKPSGNGGDRKIECKINGEPVAEAQAFTRSASSSEEQDIGHPIVEYNNDEQTAATITAPNGAVSVRFAFQGPNGDSQKATIRLANKHKYGQCGLCGHYDDTLANEWRMNNGESTNDLAAFQRSYTVLGNNVEGEICTKESAQAQYEKTKHAFSSEMFNDNEDELRSSDKKNKKNDLNFQDAEWRSKNFGGYLSEDSQEDRDFLSFGRKLNSQKKIEPVMMTKVIERSHEVCLSAKPLKQCPEGTVPASSSDNGSRGAWGSEDEGEKSNVEFVCMDRLEAYPYLRDISNKGVASNLQSVFGGRNFQMDVRQPSKCKRY